jgi:hypothetical protein
MRRESSRILEETAYRSNNNRKVISLSHGERNKYYNIYNYPFLSKPGYALKFVEFIFYLNQNVSSVRAEKCCLKRVSCVEE